MRRFGKPFMGGPDAVGEGEVGELDVGARPFCMRCWCSALALAIALLLSRDMLDVPAKDDADWMGLRAAPRTPSAVELGFRVRGSETDLKDGTLLGISVGLSRPLSSGVLAVEEDSEPGEPGAPSSLSWPTISSGVAGMESFPLMVAICGGVDWRDDAVCVGKDESCVDSRAVTMKCRKPVVSGAENCSSGAP